MANNAPPIVVKKEHPDTSCWRPLENGAVTFNEPRVKMLLITDAARRCYVECAVRAGRPIRFCVRGNAGQHMIYGVDQDYREVVSDSFVLQPQTHIACAKGPYARLAERIEHLLRLSEGRSAMWIDGGFYDMLVGWGRDHTHVLKAMKYFKRDVKSGIAFFLERQQPNGMFWDCVHPNADYPAPTWFGEALGKGYYDYSDDMRHIFRRIPVEADVEFLYTECVWYAWKASGDDAWMAAQLPRLEKALHYNAGHPVRWSEKHRLVKRSFCMDSWDFANPYYCNGDHRCVNPGDPQFLFHSDNSGLYSSYWRMAEMYDALGQHERAEALCREGEELRQRANDKLFFNNIYGHMIPESLPADDVYKLVGDERKRLSLSTGYTINRGLPTHEMAVKILREYQRRGKAKKATSFAEWWTMDPPYAIKQWPTHGPPVGEYMNGAICTIIAGEIARAACEHGCEDYACDILRRVWELSERDGGELHQVYRRLPEKPAATPPTAFAFVDLRAQVNVGLCCGALKDVPAWTDEGENDMRNLPVGRIACGPICFDVIDPAKNEGRAVLRLDVDPEHGVPQALTPVDGRKAKSLYFLHAMAAGAPRSAVVGTYDVIYKDDSEVRIYIRNNHEIGLWWGIADQPSHRDGAAIDRNIARVAWRGANPEWKNVGLFMTGWNNPFPSKLIKAIRCTAVPAKPPIRHNDCGLPVYPRSGGIMLAAISLADKPVKFEEPIRSYGLPDNWAQAAVYYAVAEGLAGIEDMGRAFDRVRVAPRWAATESTHNSVTLHYPASDGYCAYDYRLDIKKKTLTLDLTGSFDELEVHCLLPGSAKARQVLVDGEEALFENNRIEKSNYVDFIVNGLPAGPIIITW